MWRHRKGNEIPAAVLDVFDNLDYKTKDERKPVIIEQRQSGDEWIFVINLPPGISFTDVKRRQEYFENATRCNIEMTWNHNLIMKVQKGQLPRILNYEWTIPLGYDLPIPIGQSLNGLEILDLVQSPHLLIAGVPGFGKSNYLHVLINSLLPVARIGIIDLKRLEFSYLNKHCILARNEKEALQMMQALSNEMEKRIDTLERARLVKIQDYNKQSKNKIPFIVLVIDELAEIGDEKVIYYIDRIVRLARAVGISVVGATQRPSINVINGDTRAMFAARLCFQVADEVNSRMVLGENCSRAAQLSGIKGRAIYKFGCTEKEIQTMYLPVEKAKENIKSLSCVRWDYGELPDKPKRKRLPPR